GQYLSRAHRGDPGAQPPIVPVPRAEQRRAFDVLARYLFAANPLHATPALLAHLGYSEWAGYGYVSYEGYGNLPQWAYDPPERHDVPLAENIAALQDGVLKEMFSPPVLSRIADGPAETSDRRPMQLADLFTWAHDAAFSEFRGHFPRTIAPERRTLQQHYAAMLATLSTAPPAGTPDDARALARAQLAFIEAEASCAQTGAGVDATTRAHLELLRSRTYDALHPQQ
ncbi:MAG: zinc-dependent metalloprotease, partial [Candidatus Eremiobacteraeota bacterium]|nr:zinc-dependent metalloprotease [Candidatus Eremiobacteraeota bacterium]